MWIGLQPTFFNNSSLLNKNCSLTRNHNLLTVYMIKGLKLKSSNLDCSFFKLWIGLYHPSSLFGFSPALSIHSFSFRQSLRPVIHDWRWHLYERSTDLFECTYKTTHYALNYHKHHSSHFVKCTGSVRLRIDWFQC